MALPLPSHVTASSFQELNLSVVEKLEQLIRQGNANPAIQEAVTTTLNSLVAELEAAEETLGILHILDVLNNVSGQATGAITVEERRKLRASVAEEIRSLLRADVVVLYEVPESKELRTRALPGLAGKVYYPELMNNRLAADAAVKVFWREDKPTYIEDAASHPVLAAPSREGKPQSRFAIREAIASTIALPLFFHDDPIGLAFINYRTPQTFGDFHYRQVSLLTRNLPLALHSIRANRRATEYRQKHEELLRYIQEMTKQMDKFDFVCNQVIKAAVELAEAPRGSLVFWDVHSPTGQIVATYYKGTEAPLVTSMQIDRHTTFQQKILAGNVARVDDVATSEEMDAEERSFLQNQGIRSLMVVPVVDENNYVLATIGVDETAYTRHFDDHELNLCQLLANHAATVFKHIDTLTETRGVLAIQQRALEAIENHATPEDAFKIIVDEGLRLIGSDYGELLRLDSSGQYLQIEYSTKPNERGQRVAIHQSVTGMAAISKEAILIRDVQGDEEFGRLYHSVLQSNSRSELAVPLLDPETQAVIGVLNAESEHPYTFTEKHKRIWTKLATSVVRVVKLTETVAEKDALLSLNNVARRMINNPTGAQIGEFLAEIFQAAKALTDAEIGQMMLLNESNQLVIRYSTEDDIGTVLALDASVSGIAVMEGKTVNINQLDHDVHPTYGPYKHRYQWFIPGKKMQSELAVPLRFGDMPIGVINLESEREFWFTELHQGLVESLAGQAAMLIQQVQMLEDMKKLNQERLDTAIIQARTRDIDNVMHRLNNPLGAARQFAKFIQAELKKPQANVVQLHKDINMIIEQIEEVTSIIQSRTFDPRSMEAKEIDVIQQINRAVINWQRKWGERIHPVRFENLSATLHLPKVSCGDKLHEVLLDLLDNAMEAGAPERPLSITIEAQETSEWVEVKINDNGQGIPIHLRSRIFERHFSTKKQSNDVLRGLGLAWDRRYISDYGGEVDILESEIQIGTTMIVRLKKW
ncbi:MAG: GAF domain-containing protein [Caldilineaceae bacterium]|nr:GAF domain-containing protein [Caldilineaceae bacterium]